MSLAHTCPIGNEDHGQNRALSRAAFVDLIGFDELILRFAFDERLEKLLRPAAPLTTVVTVCR